ncbi:MAG: PKD domain-containing protein [Planctomycetes bacterium]|nr:PKD domain-containing protein [Planctomycetota bacterium]
MRPFERILCASSVVLLGTVPFAFPAERPPLFEDAFSLGTLAVDPGGAILRGSTPADGLELYYTVWVPATGAHTIRIWRATRASTDVPFEGGAVLGPPVNVGNWSQYAWITPDGRHLYFATGQNRPPNFGTQDVWVAVRDDPAAGTFDEAFNLGSTVNSALDEWPGCVSPDGTEFFFVREGRLVVARFVSPNEPRDGFSEVLDLAELNGWWALSPSLSPDGRRLYWSDTPPGWWNLASRPGGCGGADLWVATRFEASWGEPFGEPVNLGSGPNTAGDEICPFLSHEAETLIFSRIGGALWQAPLCCVQRDGVTASFTLSPVEATVGDEIVCDASGSEPEGSIAVYEWDFGDGGTAEGALAAHRYAAAGRYAVTLTVRTADGACDRTRELVAIGCPSGDVAPWSSADVGEPRLPGAARPIDTDGAGETVGLALCVGPYPTESRTDGWFFVHQEVEGGFRLIAKVPELAGEDHEVALLARASLAADAAFAGTIFTGRPDGTSSLYVRYRTVANESRRLVAPVSVIEQQSNVWLRLDRRGDLLVGMYSLDGENWSDLGGAEIDEIPARLQVGLAAGAPQNPILPALESFEAIDVRFSEIDLESLPAAAFRRGDCNSDGAINISDPVFNINHQFASGPAPSCLKTADANDDGIVDLGDPVFELNYLFASGPVPPMPLAECGADPTWDELSCDSYPPCE